PCPACSLRLITANKELKSDAGLKEEVNSVLDGPYNGGINVRSLLQTIYEDIGPEGINKLVKQPLKGLKVATYYGCLLLRPPKVVEFDDPENPTTMDELLQACGMDVVDFPLKTECCGAAYGLPEKGMLLRLSGNILEVASRASADAIVVACPLCHQNLDLRQGQINAKNKKDFNIPIYYFTELLGIALGFSIKEVGIDRHAVDGTKLLSAIG
ncbi:MAG: CoB--CoM heterodisulfide reductase iron-sulfur subunit B family protein, partial [Thermodesulfobacteriota bacterium]